MGLGSLTSPELILGELSGGDAMAVLREVAVSLGERGVVPDAEELYRKLWEREQLGSTGIGSEVAVPHCKVKGVGSVLVSVGLCPRGADFGSVDDRPVKVVFTVISPERAPAAHLQSLAAISKWVKREGHVERLLASPGPEAIYALLAENEA